MKDQRSQGGVLREEWDLDTRTYRAWDESGTLTTTRAFDAAENARADARLAVAAAEGNEETLRTGLGGGQVFDALRTVANGTGQFGTAAARDAAIRTCARALVILIRLRLGKLDATD